jgi:UDP-GlcNAc:undecaprenyl-phosphate/decaprenyl-phosphate GlcNAc-1-phosphate transferase
VNLELLGGAAIAAVASLIACRAIIATGPIDKATEARHAHTIPTPTSGGLAIAVGFAIGLMAIALFSNVLAQEMTARGAALLTLAASFAYGFLILGFIDDAQPLSARLKFVIFTLGALGAALSVGVVRELPLGFVTAELPFWLALFGTTLWIFTLVNCVNFMDGANGLAMGSVAIGFVALAAVSFTHGSVAGVAIGLCGAGAIAGFLFWNFPHGKLFAGDSGALFAGALAALTSLVVIHRTHLSPLVPAIIFFPLLADALLTLAWRAIRRRSLLDGHSEHLYQIAIRGGMSHPEVALIYWAATAACGAIGYLVAHSGDIAPWVALAGMSFAAFVISVVVRRFADRRGIGGV